MKKSKMFLGLAIIVFAFGACKKDSSTSDSDYLLEIVGTYQGEFISQPGLKSDSQGIAVISNVNNQLQIHCYGELMDTTFIMDAFENGDSIMICATGEAFEHEYGHMGSGANHMMDMHDNETEWLHHMSDDHHTGDLHYGGFSMSHHTFEYTFQMMEGDSAYVITFNGSKNQ